MIDSRPERIGTPLVRRAQAGDRTSVAELLRLSRPLAERTVARRCFDHQMIDDLTQAVLLVVLMELPGLRCPEAYISWLLRIVANVCCKQARRSTCLQTAASRLAQESLAEADARFVEVDPEEAAVRAEIQAHLRIAVAALPARYRTAVVMRAVQGHSFDEIGETLGCPRELARLWYFRARRRLQRLCVADEVLAPVPAT
ncbi:MAG: RNA polymerase sigma factor [Candidatus Dormibacteraeota bacterium]|uniref:RNA polymerase sigma factor n=1 Tax=Candidatus Aeolococcus gillhamiae TaxID=3127015 RepID=A0A2W6A1K6_9BACT|nr:RNA polymerase sigma factor [Candidatus Dormibacteraeota bacterium]PZR77564.1 MAG: hypothetical protein DLM65_15390 [Candidatus Dormibacter sp. RRmetagenome_bin12]